VAAGIHKRVGQLLAAQPAPEVVLPEEMDVYPDNDHDWPPDEALAPKPTPPAGPLPEARSSVNVRLQVHGHDCQVTLRDHDEAALLARLEKLLQRYPLPEAVEAPRGPSQPASPEPEKRFCPRHGSEMQQNHKEGRSWWSHRTPDGQWCKGR